MSIVVMTGGSSGFGKFAAEQLVRDPETRLLLGVHASSGPGRAEAVSLDLARLASVRCFASEINARIKGQPVDVLICNAGVSLPGGDSRTADGFETTFAVNHLAHYLLVHLLLPAMADGARLVLTTSGTHDPAEKTVIPPPRHANVEWLAYPEKNPHLDDKPAVAGGRAYSSSKLCVLLTARALAEHPDIRRRGIRVLAYDPGPVPGTGLVRHAAPVIRAAWSVLGMPWVRPWVSGFFNSAEAAGGALADLAAGRIAGAPERVYAALRRNLVTWPDPSELALQEDAMRAVWRDSALLLGLDWKKTIG